MKLLKLLAIPFIGMAITFAGCQTSSINVSVKTEMDSVSYALGINIAASMKQSDLTNINELALAKGLREAFDEKEGVMTNEEAIDFLNKFMAKDREKKAQAALMENAKFLEENAKKEGVIVDPSGLQYKILVEGNGPKPLATDVVKVHYHGTRIDGTVFDSSVERGEPAQFPLNRVIPGWTIGLQHMSVGSKYIFYIPSELAYGPNPRPGGPVKPNDLLIFEVELFEINPVDEN
jgi:FKBP-type peptidyl-prolyl cis-trans isomerase